MRKKELEKVSKFEEESKRKIKKINEILFSIFIYKFFGFA